MVIHLVLVLYFIIGFIVAVCEAIAHRFLDEIDLLFVLFAWPFAVFGELLLFLVWAIRSLAGVIRPRLPKKRRDKD